ncbi:MAG: S-layer homology domain-containing protein [Oscillospiraceae bacterium]|nr:S-layer homology domain-containing protein [Oscillospiraceae bacterium]
MRKKEYDTKQRQFGGGRHARQLCGLLLTFAMLLSLFTVASAAPPPPSSASPWVFGPVYDGDDTIYGSGAPGATINVYIDALLIQPPPPPTATATADADGYWAVNVTALTTNNDVEIRQVEPSKSEGPGIVAEVFEYTGDNRFIVIPRDMGRVDIPGIHGIDRHDMPGIKYPWAYQTKSGAIATFADLDEDADYPRGLDSGTDRYMVVADYAVHVDAINGIYIFEALYNVNSSALAVFIKGINGTESKTVYKLAGEQVDLDAGTYPDASYVFDTWATTPNTTLITTPNLAVTDFVMPNEDTEAEAHWQYTGAGAGTGAGGTGSGGGSTGNVPPAPISDAVVDGGGDPGEDGGDGDGSGTTAAPSGKLLPRFALGLEDDFIPLAVFNPKHVLYLYGYEEGNVLPDASITRSEASVLLFRILSDPDRFRRLDNPFEFADWEWYYDAVTYLSKIGVIAGYDDGSFRADSNITRAEFVTMISRFGLKEGPMELVLSDVAGHWAEEYIDISVSNGLISGYPDGTFRPDGNITRAEVVSIINRLLYRGIEVEDIPEWAPGFWDLKIDHWAYADIKEASIGHEFERKDNGYEIWTGEL